ncbi:H-NS histone family protein [Cupriavidus sp. AcVe19-6a]|nr:H-NS histone family protein [Cupriavidus sp. AcVe19-6a]
MIRHRHRLPRPVCYRNAEGLSWDGQGEMPAWLRRAVNAGQHVEFSGS